MIRREKQLLGMTLEQRRNLKVVKDCESRETDEARFRDESSTIY
jgi:hypothetical protein